jgi:uncharacterized protein
MRQDPLRPVVHIELHTRDLERAREVFERLCGWRSDEVDAGCGSYATLGLGGRISGGIVECATLRSLWLPYVEVADIEEATRRARALGASTLLEPREGPAGWRSVIASPATGEIAFWQPKR